MLQNLDRHPLVSHISWGCYQQGNETFPFNFTENVEILEEYGFEADDNFTGFPTNLTQFNLTNFNPVVEGSVPIINTPTNVLLVTILQEAKL